MFAPDAISSSAPEFAITFEPDGRTAYFNRASADRSHMAIRVARWTGARWQSALAPFSGTYRDIDPYVTYDGQRLYFSSDRPAPGRAADRADLDLWYLERDGDGWGEARHIDGSPNDSDSIGFVSLTRDGTLYFDAFEGGKKHMYRAPPLGTGFGPRERLAIDAGPNQLGNPLVAPDGSFIVFYGVLPDSQGGTDLYVTQSLPGGGWSPGRNLGPAVNSPGGEFAPGWSPDGRYFFFTAERPSARTPSDERPPGEIYRIDAAALDLDGVAAVSPEPERQDDP